GGKGVRQTKACRRRAWPDDPFRCRFNGCGDCVVDMGVANARREAGEGNGGRGGAGENYSAGWAIALVARS
ncbi:MAG: hypothetical protein KDJ53_12305, partial [Rhodobiaceae bacterium]|nr:hypothetical protein [Rhodobiaceae bacterium]